MGEKSQYKVKSDISLQLSFTVLIHEHENAAEVAEYLKALTK